MLFRPSFCANCGEKIERAEWSILTSRRFCQVCESEFKGHDLVPRVVVGLGVLAMVFGFGSYLKSGSTADTQVLRQPRKLVEQTIPATQLTAPDTAQRVPNVIAANTGQLEQRNISQTSGTPGGLQPPKAKAAVEEPMYYCGAETKKGTPCSRRVKGNIRCFQHQGMPAMLPADKLRIK